MPAASARLVRAVCFTAAAVSAASLAGVPAVAHGASAPTRPPGREWPSLAYDPARHELVLFGGDDLGAANPSGGFRGTWTRTGTRWTKQHPANSPSGRTGAAMAYDAATRQVVLFGGSSPGGGVDAQTWIWTGSNWRRLHPATSPRARADANLVYDAARHELILFGGYQGRTCGCNDRIYFGDTWAWTGRTWRHLHPAASPTSSSTGSMVYDNATKTVILFGGIGKPGTWRNEMWAWNGKTWHELRSRAPRGTYFGWQVAYDPATSQLLAFGSNIDPPVPLLWAWTGGRWRKLHPAASSHGRNLGAMTYDSGSRQVVLFGGSGARPGLYPDSTWTWNGTNWHTG
jgi:hypothetical protein